MEITVLPKGTGVKLSTILFGLKDVCITFRIKEDQTCKPSTATYRKDCQDHKIGLVNPIFYS